VQMKVSLRDESDQFGCNFHGPFIAQARPVCIKNGFELRVDSSGATLLNARFVFVGISGFKLNTVRRIFVRLLFSER
jgi:hypothetical protein